jgi:hypothetical protein
MTAKVPESGETGPDILFAGSARPSVLKLRLQAMIRSGAHLLVHVMKLPPVVLRRYEWPEAVYGSIGIVINFHSNVGELYLTMWHWH